MWFFAQFRLRFSKYFRSHKNGMVHDRKNGFVDIFLSVFSGFKVTLTQSNVFILSLGMPKHWSFCPSGWFIGKLHDVNLISVSFFGASHINMPLQEAKLSTNIRLKFRSRQADAMIFLTSGRTDHCLLTMNDGRIKFQLKVNEYETEVI